MTLKHTGPHAMTQLIYTREEIEVLLAAVAEALRTIEGNRAFVITAEVRALMDHRWSVLNSLRTSLAEARYGLMSREELEQEQKDLDEARAAGIRFE